MVNHHLEKSLSGQSTHLLKELPVWRIRIDVAQAKSSFGAGLKQLLYLVSSVSHLSLWIISRNPTIIWIIWITYFRCGGLASHVRPQTRNVRCWALLSALPQRFEFGPDPPQGHTTHADNVLVESYHIKKKKKMHWYF